MPARGAAQKKESAGAQPAAAAALFGRAPLGPIDLNKMNPKFSSVSLVHPFAATVARILSILAKQLHYRGSFRGLISIFTAGFIGVTAILER